MKVIRENISCHMKFASLDSFETTKSVGSRNTYITELNVIEERVKNDPRYLSHVILGF